MVRTGALTAEGPGLIPGQGTKIPQAAQHSQKKKKKNYTSVKLVFNMSLYPFQNLELCHAHMWNQPVFSD